MLAPKKRLSDCTEEIFEAFAKTADLPLTVKQGLERKVDVGDFQEFQEGVADLRFAVDGLAAGGGAPARVGAASWGPPPSNLPRQGARSW